MATQLQNTGQCLSHDMVLCMIKGEVDKAVEMYEDGNQDMALKELSDAHLIIEHYLKDHNTTPGKVLEDYERKHMRNK